MAEYNSKGQEMPDQTPLELPVGYRQPETLQAMIQRMVRIHSLAAVQDGLESFEDADDFDADDDEPVSEHQMTQMQEETPRHRENKNTDRRKQEETKPPAEPVEPAAALKK